MTTDGVNANRKAILDIARIDSNEKTPSGCLVRGVKGFIASMKKTPWKGVFKNECKKSWGDVGASSGALWQAAERGPQ
jgi:hypothetical protein